MQYFEAYSSNTIAGSGNQHFFSLPQGEIKTGRAFYKIAAPGEYAYSLLFSNIIDSTYAKGDISHKNLVCDEWQIHFARIGKVSSLPSSKPIPEMNLEEDIVISDWQELSFRGSQSKTVAPGEFFSSDPIPLAFKKGEYLCLELTFSGPMIPYHEESILPLFVKENGKWAYCKKMPLPGMIGCDRPVTARIGYIGDSITQGIGTPINAYSHWNALLSEKIGHEYAHWNLGLGYGRANDMASGGAWLYKAKQNDILFVCYGVNDILQGFSEEQIKKDLAAIVRSLKQLNKTVILQTIPPFNYADEKIETWLRLNDYIKTELAREVDLVFDNVPCLGQNEAQPYLARYGGHPDEVGCAAWAAAFFDFLGRAVRP